MEIKDMLEIAKEIFPVILTGIITFLITRYEYHKNVPLEKFELAYNRIYYPIYQAIKDENDIQEILVKCEYCLKKYKKYMDRSTLCIYRQLKSAENVSIESKEYRNFKDNIFNLNSSLRRRLGYLEPSFTSMYKYIPASEKLMIRVAFYIIIFEIVSVCYIVENEDFRYGLSVVCSIILIAFAIEVFRVFGWIIKWIFNTLKDKFKYFVSRNSQKNRSNNKKQKI